MMFPGWGMGGWMLISYGFVVLLILVGIVVALVALSRRTGRNGPPGRAGGARVTELAG
jgi:hypothetical protein